MSKLLYRHRFDAATLMVAHPPQWKNPNKAFVAQKTCPASSAHRGTIVVSRWANEPFLDQNGLSREIDVDAVANYFDYAASDKTNWYLNFADSNLFGYYAGPLLAQDELQVLEHPILGAVREGLLAQGLSVKTTEGANPTPILIRGVERRAVLDTAHLYGNRFAAADVSLIESSLTILNRPTMSNILAMEAPPGGVGRYSRSQIEQILTTAITGFSAARMEASGPTEIHTGFWGCGAYGGNRTLMTLLQILAGKLAGIDRLVFHTGDQLSLSTIASAQQELAQLLDPSSLDRTISALAFQGYQWGVSDGN